MKGKTDVYHEIHRLDRREYNKSQTEQKDGVNRNTVRKYMAKDFTRDLIPLCIGL